MAWNGGWMMIPMWRGRPASEIPENPPILDNFGWLKAWKSWDVNITYSISWWLISLAHPNSSNCNGRSIYTNYYLSTIMIYRRSMMTYNEYFHVITSHWYKILPCKTWFSVKSIRDDIEIKYWKWWVGLFFFADSSMESLKICNNEYNI